MSDLDVIIADETRIHQTVQITRATPFLIMGNFAALIPMVSAAQYAVISSYAIVPIIFLFVLLAPMAMSYRNLRHMPRPVRTSKRRIRRIEIHSLLMGLCWAMILALLFRDLNSHQHIWVVTATLFLAFGSAPSVSSIPRAAVGFSLPMMFTSWLFSHASGHFEAIVVLAYHFGAIVTFAKVLLDNWRLFQDNVVVSMEHTDLLNKRLQAEQELRQSEIEAAAKDHERQDEVTRAQRRLIDAIPFPLVLTRESGVLPIGKHAAQLFDIQSEDLAEHEIGEFFVDPSDEERMWQVLAAEVRSHPSFSMWAQNTFSGPLISP